MSNNDNNLMPSPPGGGYLPAVEQGTRAFELLQRKAQAMASSDIAPQQFRGNVANCIIALDLADRMDAAPLMVMQNLYVVHGMPAWSSKFLLATINASGRFTTLRYEFTDAPQCTPQWGCRCVAYERDDAERLRPLEGEWVTWEMAEREGWTKKSGSKWATMPGQMMRYRAVAFWQRAFAPELSFGLLTREEAVDIIDVEASDLSPRARLRDIAAGRASAPVDIETDDDDTDDLKHVEI